MIARSIEFEGGGIWTTRPDATPPRCSRTPRVHAMAQRLAPNFRRENASSAAKARAAAATMCASLRLILGVLLCSQEVLSLRVPSVASRRRLLAGAGAAAAASAVPALASAAYATQGSNPGLADGVPGRAATHTCEPRLGQAVVRLLPARPGAGRRGAGALARQARRHQLHLVRVRVRVRVS